jgi:hypothetical protein
MNKLRLSSAPPLAAHSLNFVLSQTTEQAAQRKTLGNTHDGVHELSWRPVREPLTSAW